VNVHVVPPAELGAGECDRWRALQAASPELGSPFLAPEFALAVGRARSDARVAVVEDADGLAGFFAFQLDTDGAGRPIGAGICDAQAFVCRPALEWDAGWLVEASGLVSWRFDHLAIDQRPFTPFHVVRHRSPIMCLERGHGAFLEDVRARSKDVIAQVARRRRKLGREVGPVQTTWDDRDESAWSQLVTWKSAQYAATGTWDRFDHQWIRQVLDELRAERAPGCAGLVATTRAGNHVGAVHFGLLGRNALSWWFPTYDPALAPYSPGLILLLDLAEQAAERGLSMIDLGRGEHDYKLRVATGAYEVAEGEVPAR
jgi:CelD/BcsL family acetyltransferase involved in cellulose biosynthesis